MFLIKDCSLILFSLNKAHSFPALAELLVKLLFFSNSTQILFYFIFF